MMDDSGSVRVFSISTDSLSKRLTLAVYVCALCVVEGTTKKQTREPAVHN